MTQTNKSNEKDSNNFIEVTVKQKKSNNRKKIKKEEESISLGV